LGWNLSCANQTIRLLNIWR